MEISPLQQKVIDEAKKIIGNKDWYCGLCFDGLMSDEEITLNGIEDAAIQLAMETAMWDAPDFFNP